MAKQAAFKSASDVDLEDLSAENSDPADATLSDSSDLLDLKAVRTKERERVSRQLLDKKQLEHDVQLLKIELSKKSLTLECMTNEHAQRVDELEEKLTDSLHQRQLLQAKLEAQLNVQQDESKRRQDAIRHELEGIQKRQAELEIANQRLSQKAGDLKRTLRETWEVTEAQYYELRSQDEESMTLRDFVVVRYYEAVRPVRTEIEELRSRCQRLVGEVADYELRIADTREELSEERRQRAELQAKCTLAVAEARDAGARAANVDHRVTNYDRVLSERDALDKELAELRRRTAYSESAGLAAARERDELAKEVQAARSSLALLGQDKDYLSKHAADLASKLSYCEDRLRRTTGELDEAKQSREELYDKYVESRDRYKCEYEQRLRDEVDKMRARTDDEIERLRSGTKEMHDRENRSLREAKESALAERDAAVQSERALQKQHDELRNEVRQRLLAADSKIGDLQSELKLIAFDKERTSLLYEESLRNVRDSHVETDKLQKKLEMLTKEYYQLESGSAKKLAEAESKLGELRARLDGYEQIERELDDVIMQAAEVEGEEDAERVMLSYGYGATLPSSSQRRMKQSVHLARRCLRLERQTAADKRDLDEHKERIRQLSEQLKKANDILNEAQQPYNYLIDRIKARDAEADNLKDTSDMLRADLSKVKEERNALVKKNNLMAADLERLLQHQDELQTIRSLLSRSRSAATSPGGGGRSSVSSLKLAQRSVGGGARTKMASSRSERSVEEPSDVGQDSELREAARSVAEKLLAGAYASRPRVPPTELPSTEQNHGGHEPGGVSFTSRRFADSTVRAPEGGGGGRSRKLEDGVARARPSASRAAHARDVLRT